ncbi:MAG: metallophosphoesterase [Pseudomonadales bacterium]|nr:metallophosphoesterase [Pseudomonadales bacterium]
MQIHVIGDLHGFYPEFESLLAQTGIIDQQLNWSANDDQLWLIGDLFDRGQQTLACIELIMKLQLQAPNMGGQVACLLGNHELMFLAAHKFSNKPVAAKLVRQWLDWGGHGDDFQNISAAQLEWLSQLPAMALIKNSLLIHADNLSYVRYGQSITEVNAYFQALMDNLDFELWQQVLTAFSARGAFNLRLNGPKNAAQMLHLYGGSKIIHGHTPIPIACGKTPQATRRAFNYADGLCYNVDAGIYLGSPGFVFSY